MRTVRCSALHGPPRTEFLTHACQNISFPQLLWWTVKKSNQSNYGCVAQDFQIPGNTIQMAPDLEKEKPTILIVRYLVILNWEVWYPISVATYN